MAGGHYSREGLAYLEFRVSGLGKKLDRIKGKFVSSQVEIKGAHERMAQSVVETMQAVLKERIEETGRPQRDGQALVSVIASPDNWVASADGFSAGLPSFLSGSKARTYWRNLEVGTDIFVGRQFMGFFRSLEGKTYGPSSARFRRDVRLVQTGSTIGEGGAMSERALARTIHGGRSVDFNFDHRGEKIHAEDAGSNEPPMLSLGQSHEQARQFDHPRGAPSQINQSGIREHITGHEQSFRMERRVEGGEGSRTAFNAGGGRLPNEPRGRQGGQWLITIHRPIPAYEYMAEGALRYLNSGRADVEYQRALVQLQEFMAGAAGKGLSVAQARRSARSGRR